MLSDAQGRAVKGTVSDIHAELYDLGNGFMFPVQFCQRLLLLAKFEREMPSTKIGMYWNLADPTG